MTATSQILVVAEHDHGSIRSATLNTVAAALQCGTGVHVLVAGHQAAGAASAAAAIPGVARVLHVDAAHLADGLAENIAAQVVALAAGYGHILFPATSAGKNVAPRVAALLDVAQVSEIVRVVSPDTFERPIYAGNALVTVQSSDPVKVLTVRVTGFDAVPAEGGAAQIDTVDPVTDSGLSTFVECQVAKSDRPELADAQIVVSGGRALGSSEKFAEVLTPLADKLGAALGASRAAVDAGFAPNDWQVGQTGKIVAPQLYVACGISGAIQHLAGMKDSKVIVAINKDPEAPIFSIADYALEADLFDAVPQLVNAI
ncbi:electron transfer flavoprotein subunit alpha/FixB family protein [Paraburkholderia saeva]|uniref:electron transfer flavoprotein subunit alpha/FixB family protein n=1 Tax=Paraburkholderia saeva TaxID=2777537 RepID=UPI001DFA09A3|nr:FAD-binding protein [Paraburkholderia saeva]CAG4889788.1 Electron transfer flavoprotein subunit alpha [Paraburkholderia saeva]CAG4897229.1 Electron transfer flavoprotein subunit alpha [Paraburkholderia saeva]